MKLSAFVAFRYLRSPKSHSVINMISWVAGAAIAVPTAALVIILSLHNGLSDMIEGLYNSFDSQIRITPAEGKYFDPKTLNLEGIDEIERMSYVIEDNVLLRKEEREHLATLRGVDSNYSKVIPIEKLITHGKYEPQLGDLRQAVVGQGIAYNLGISVSLIEPIDIYAIRPNKGTSVIPSPIYRTGSIIPVGVYTLDEQTDNKYIFIPLSLAQELLGFAGKISSVEISLKKGVDPIKAKIAIVGKIGDQFRIETRFEQKESLYRAINQEKWIIFLLLIMVLVIAAMSLAGSIIILIADKRSQISTLESMGANTKLIRSIFRWEGMFIVAIGSLVGLMIGTGFSLLQQHFGLIKMAGETMLTDVYPVRVAIPDILIITAGVWSMGWLISTITTHAALKNR